MVFEVFRRRQKQMLAALAILAIFGFILGDVFTRIAYRSQESFDRVAVTAWGKKIYESQVQRRQRERQLISMFFAKAFERIRLAGPPQWDDSADAAIESLVLAEKGRQMGIPVDDREVDEFIQQTAEKKLSKAAYLGALSDVSSGFSALSEHELFRIIAEELLVEKVLRALTPAGTRETPLEVWARQEPTLVRIKLDVVRIPVERFVDKSEAPTDEQLKELFEAHQSVDADPERGIIGFRVPRRVQVQYLTARVDKFTSDVTVTDAEVQQYYEQHKDEFKAEPKPATTKDDSIPKPPTIKPKTQKEKADEKTKPKSPSEKPAPPKAEPKPSEPSKPKDKSEAPKPVEVDKAPKKGPEKSASVFPLPFGALSVVVTQQSDPQKSAAADKPATKPTPVAPTKKPAPSPSPEPSSKSKERPKDAKFESTPAIEPQESDAKVKTDQVAAVKFKALDEVKVEIVDKLKRQKATERIERLLRQIRDVEMYSYYDAYETARRAHRAATGKGVETGPFQPPTPPDLKAVAQKHGLELHQTALITLSELAKLDGLGIATPASGSEMARSYPDTVAQQDLYLATVLRETSGQRLFLAWKTQDHQAHVPDLEEVRTEVIAAWRTQQASPRAEAEAKRLVEAAEKAGGDLAKVMPKDGGYSLVSTNEFSRKQRRFQAFPFQGAPQSVSPTIPEVPNAGEEFLDAVFALKPGTVKALPDEHKRNYYVVRVAQRTEPDFQRFVDELRLERLLRSQTDVVHLMIQARREWPTIADPLMRLQWRITSESFFRPTIESVMREANLKIESADDTSAEEPATG
jgi:hypothetical protein